MAKQYSRLEPHHQRFIENQNIFFTASSASSGRVNVSPRSTDLLRIVDDRLAIYLDRTGSGNETAAHLLRDGRLTLMFCSFSGAPLILRLYGAGSVIHRENSRYSEILGQHYGGVAPLGARQIIQLDVDLVQSSCGYGVPLYQYQSERTQMDDWASAKGVDGIEAYWHEKNQESLDGFSTGLLDGRGD
jgi:hypothetical protein